MLKRLVAVLVLLFVVIAGAAELVLPGVVSRELAQGLQQTFGTGDAMTVKLRSFPALRLLTGHLDEITVVSSNVPAGSLNLDSLSVTMTGVSVNMRDLLTHKGLEVKHAAGAKVVITVSQESLRRYLLSNVQGLADPMVAVGPDGLGISGNLTVAGRKVKVAFMGGFSLKNDHWVSFELKRVAVGDVPVPEAFLPAFLSLLGTPELGIDLSKFPLPLKGTAVRLEPGKLIIEAVSS